MIELDWVESGEASEPNHIKMEFDHCNPVLDESVFQ